MQFDKQPLRTEQHLELLTERCLVINNPEKAAYYIQKIGYFRLTGYMYPFQVNEKHEFKPTTTFEAIINTYKFDKKLRWLLLDAIERIEVCLRAMISNKMSLNYGAHWYLDTGHFNDKGVHASFINNLSGAVNDSNDLFIKNYLNKYSSPAMPPSWMVMELLTFGSLTSMFCNLKNSEEKQEIAKELGCVTPILESWLKSINYIRNCCAHHTRLWNKKIPLKPIIPVRKGKAFLKNVDDETNLRLYGITSCILYMLNNINPTCKFKNRLLGLIKENPEIPIRHMGFPAAFDEEDLWRV